MNDSKTPTVDFTDLENLSDLEPTGKPLPGPKKHVAEMGKTTYPFPCPKCRGTGVFTYGYQYIRTGKCHACNGRGGFATSPEDRQNARMKAAGKKMAEASSKALAVKAFFDTNPDVRAWFDRKLSGRTVNEFAESLMAGMQKYGRLTDNQLAAIRRDIVKFNEFEAARKEAIANPKPLAADALSLRNVPSGMYAVPGGDTRLKVQIDNVVSGKWDGWIFVKDGAVHGSGKRYGKQRPTGAYEGEIAAELRIIASDPRAASAAYGKLVGRCGCCGRTLENAESIAAGIGPICAQKNGW